MEVVDLKRFEITGPLGSGADYEVRAAIDLDTGAQVVLKRPVPQMISRQMHGSTETRTDQMLEVFQILPSGLPGVSPIIGYSERTNHDEIYGDALGQEYRVIVEDRALGIPLMVGDMRARIQRVPTGVGQNLFTLHPLNPVDQNDPFPVHRQLLDAQEAFLAAGYVLFDMRPQNLFYQPGSGRLTIIDCADLAPVEGAPSPRGGPVRDVFDSYLEILKFYTTAQRPPDQADGYREPFGQRPVVNFQQELDEMSLSYSGAEGPVSDAAQTVIDKLKEKAYSDLSGFRHDLNHYLHTVAARNQQLPFGTQAIQAWTEALDMLRGDYWKRFLFDADTELAGLSP
jgi:hypothetical protein